MKSVAWGKGSAKSLTVIFLSVFGLAGCDMPVAKNNMDGSLVPTAQAPEPAYCASAIFYSDLTSSLNGKAYYQRREPFGTWGSGGLGAPSSPRPIRYAEVVVTNSMGQVIQCGETDATGFYSVIVPNNSGLVTVSVRARANNAQMNAAVYDDPRYNNVYSISEAVQVSTSIHNMPDMIATATGDVLGGAFNILDQFLDANIYLRSQVGNCSSSFTGCADFNVAPRVTAYWKLGFNPAEYYGSSSGISFYIPGYSRLFILGGIDGDSDHSDTDHFDNSVILHEYGHFLEDTLFTSDSPGGAHNGNKVIDPRLAWSEGWGNFFQAAVRNNASYMDTEGNVDGSTGFLFLVDLENQTRDIPENPGEGNFREFAVTRFLWDAVDGTGLDSGGNDNISNRFIEIYHSLQSAAGWMLPSASFRQIGLMSKFQSTLGTSSWSSIRAIEQQIADTRDYAQYVAVGTSCVSFVMTPQNLMTDNGSYATSHLLLNNDFYHLRITGPMNVTLKLEYRVANDGYTDPDLDLFLYNENGRFGVGEDMVAKSLSEPLSLASNPSRVQTETISAHLKAGNYLINVMTYTGGFSVGGQSNYSLTLNGSQLCPSDLP